MRSVGQALFEPRNANKFHQLKHAEQNNYFSISLSLFFILKEGRIQRMLERERTEVCSRCLSQVLVVVEHTLRVNM